MKKPIQTVIPKQVVEMAKFIQACDQDKNIQGFIIGRKKAFGKNAALRLARNNN